MRVALICPSRGRIPETVDKAVNRLEEAGFEVIKGKFLIKKELYWSGTAEERAQDINKAFASKNIDLIWCISGGLTSLELIPLLDYNTIRQNKKLFIGYSDITSIQHALFHYADLPTIQFYMPGSDDWIEEKDEEHLNDILKHKDVSIPIKQEQIFSEGETEGTLIGGCLDLLCSTIGTEHEIQTNGKILYLEDANISPQRLYNDLTHLMLTGKFDNIKGLIMAGIWGKSNFQPYIELFLNKLNLKIPIILNLDAGHMEHKYPIILGAKVKINTKVKTIEFEFPKKILK